MADTRKIAQVLGRSRLLAGARAEDLEQLATMVRGRKVEAGETLFREGTPGDSMALVVDGLLAVTTEGGATVATLGPGEVVGEMSCVDPAPRSATVRATRDSVVVEIDRGTLLALQRALPAVALCMTREIIQTVTRRIRDTNALIDRLWQGFGQRADAAEPPPPAASEAPRGVDLKALPTFRGYAERELSALVAVAPPRRFPDGQVLCREGARGASCFVLAWGQVHVLKAVGPRERLLGVLEAGAMVGQMALVDSSPRSATVRTSGEVIALELHRDAFERLVAAASPLAVRFQEQIAIAGIRQLRAADARLTQAEREARAVGQGAPSRPNQLTVAYMDAALREWGMDLADLDRVTVAHPDGIMTQAEIKARMARR